MSYKLHFVKPPRPILLRSLFLTVLRSYALTVFLLSPFSFFPLFAQQLQLKGVVTVQNSKTYTGKTQFVKNAEVEHINRNNAKTKDVTGDDGKFTLNIKGASANTQTQITVTPFGEFADYVVVNEKELKDITLGRVTPVSVFVCKKGDLEKRQAEMVGINMRKLEEKMEADKKRLQKELDAIRANNDYLNVRYSQIKDSLDIISKNIDNAFERIKEYAKTMTLENLDDRDENYVKAYECFSRGALDSVSYYLQENDLDLKYQKFVQLQQESKKEKELAAVLTESAKAKEEFTKNIKNELIKEWLLLARTAVIQNDYEKTIAFYEKIVQVDSLNAEIMLEYATFLHKYNEFEKAENYYQQCLKINRALATENPKIHLQGIAKTLNSLALLHKKKNEYSLAIKEFEEALHIFKEFATSKPDEFLPHVATALHNLATLHRELNDYSVALQEFEEALKIRRVLAEKDSNLYLSYVAISLNDLANFYNYNKKYFDALQKYEEALQIRRRLVDENPKENFPFIAQILNNLAALFANNKEYSKALPKYEEALLIRKKLEEENPRVYLPAVAQTLNNLAIVYKNINEIPNALEKYEEALLINRRLAVENPKVYLPIVAQTLHNAGILHLNNKDFRKALPEFEESLEIRRKFAEETPKKYLPDVINSLNCLGILYYSMNQFTEALEKMRETLKIYEELSIENPNSYFDNIVATLSDISLFSIYLQKFEQAEQYAQRAIEMDSNYFHAKRNFAHALLFQNRFEQAKIIYKEILQTIWNDNENPKHDILEDFELFEKAGAIPKKQKRNVEKIKEMVQK